ncbi:hypothetical protein [Ornithinimicrobium pratense]|uniref:Uncharacterized protein n=1 Tax=Ornithinimicrobium pratense TaxID=2593973 RepID=A0A5J6V6J0_9MICO|nr:hypothetical protein [Ornithinimicrobium pratense]QFG69509.1 hypothetical protein FY030_13070 [Ornithinimicrobium pratense]
MRALHERAAAELIAHQVEPKATPGSRAVLILGLLLVIAAGVLGATLLGDLGSPREVTAALLLAVLVLGGWAFFYLTLDELTQEIDARNLAMGAVLDGTFSSPLQVRQVARVDCGWLSYLSAWLLSDSASAEPSGEWAGYSRGRASCTR